MRPEGAIHDDHRLPLMLIKGCRAAAIRRPYVRLHTLANYHSVIIVEKQSSGVEKSANRARAAPRLVR
jgi:hypothetical protein